MKGLNKMPFKDFGKEIFVLNKRTDEVVTKKERFDTRSLINKVPLDEAGEEGLTKKQYKLFSDRWNALFQDLDYSADPYTGFDDRFDDEGMPTYPNNTRTFEGKTFYLADVQATLEKNRQHSLNVGMLYKLPANISANKDSHRVEERSHEYKPLYNYHYSSSCECIYYTTTDGSYLFLRYTVIPTPSRTK